MQGSTPPKLPREFLSIVDLDDIDFVWFQSSTGDHGVCAVDVPSKCAMAFLAYESAALDKEPYSILISTCGPM